MRRGPALLRPPKFPWPKCIEETPDDFYFVPTREETQLDRLRCLEREWARRELFQLRRRAAELTVVVAADCAYVERQNALEAEIQRRKNYYEAVHKDEADQERKWLLARLEKATKEMNKSDVRAEHRELLRRGVYRGRRRAVSGH
jgi:chromosome segregation ATPase